MSNNNKYLYSFEVEEKEGKKRKFALVKPNRKLKEEGELYYASKLSQFIGAGILPRILWDKLFKDQGGIVAEVDKKEYSSLYIKLVEAREKIEKISAKKESDRTEDEKNKLAEVQAEVVLLRKQMQEMELSQINAFEYTAEAKARNKSIVWWAANLAVEEDSTGDYKKLLGDGDIDSKLDYYDEIVENDKFLDSVFSRINYLITVWYLGSANSFAEFEFLDKEFLKRENEKDDGEEVPAKVEDKKVEEDAAVVEEKPEKS